jgi:tRNA threonylcarbamoyladenosine biosynthesis protein TsaB
MILLMVDTSGRQGSIALAHGGPGEACEVIEMSSLTGGTFSSQLVPQIAEMLVEHRFSKNDIGAFVAVTGPGSFTGLRVGLAAVKALAEVLGKPIAPVSLLEALASAGHTEGRIISVIDAGRNAVYVGEYDVDGAGIQTINERLLSHGELFESAIDGTIVTPDKTIAELSLAKGLRVVEVARGLMDAIARLGWVKIVTGGTISPEALEANYLQRSDTEIFTKTDAKPLRMAR